MQKIRICLFMIRVHSKLLHENVIKCNMTDCTFPLFAKSAAFQAPNWSKNGIDETNVSEVHFWFFNLKSMVSVSGCGSLTEQSSQFVDSHSKHFVPEIQ